MDVFGPIADGVGFERTLLAAAVVTAVANVAVAFTPAVRAVTAAPAPAAATLAT
jgi:hypothetical protein